MDSIWYILIIILVICIALIIIVMRSQSRIVGGDEYINPLVIQILDSFRPYIDKPNNISTYLRDYISGRAPTKLDGIVNQIIHEHNIEDVRDFWVKMKIQQSAFLPKSKSALLNDIYLTPKSKDVNKIMPRIDNYLVGHGKPLSDRELKRLADSLLKYNRVYKFKDNMVNMSVSRLRKLIKSNPESVIEHDIIPIVMRLEPCTVISHQRQYRSPVDLSVEDLRQLLGQMERTTLLDEIKKEKKRLEIEKSTAEKRRLEEKIKHIQDELTSLRKPPPISEGTQTETVNETVTETIPDPPDKPETESVPDISDENIDPTRDAD